jgi:hypothetical protein
MLLYTSVLLLNAIRLPTLDDSGNVKNTSFGMLYLEFTRLQVRIRESVGDMTGVSVDNIWILVGCGFAKGYVPNVKPIKFPKDCPNVSLGVWATKGNVHVAFDGFTYPFAVASDSVGIT